MAVTINGVSPTTAQQREFAAAMGLPVLLQTVTVASAQQDIDFTSLDLDADGTYRIELTVSVHSAAAQDVFVYYNGDTTAANYLSQALVGNGSSTFAARVSTAFAALGGSPGSSAYSISAGMNVCKVSGKPPALASQSTYIDGSSIVTNTIAHKWSGTANVISIKLRNPNNFGVGTVAKIYKV